MEEEVDELTATIEKLVKVVPEEWDPRKTVWVDALLLEAELVSFLSNMDVFAWSHKDMSGIAPEHGMHSLNLDLPSHQFVRNKGSLLQNGTRL